MAVPRDQLPLASLQGLPGKTGIPAVPRPPAPAPRGRQSRGWALPPGWDSSAVRCIEEGGRRGEEGKERGEGGEGSQRIIAAVLAVFSANVKDTPFFGRNASKSFICTPPLPSPQPFPMPRAPAGRLQHPWFSLNTTPASLWERVWGFISIAELQGCVSDMHSSCFKPQEGLRWYFGGRGPGFNTYSCKNKIR